MSAKVYFTKDISPAGLAKIYEKLKAELVEKTGRDFEQKSDDTPRKIGVKVSTGEAGSKGYLKAELVGPLVKSFNGTIVECNTAYPGARTTAEEHIKVAADHGFTSFAEVDIMDSEGEKKIPVKNGKHMKYDLVGTHIDNYDAMLNLAHGKGHAMGGFGGSLKNQSIGIASRNGKAYIHSAGKTKSPKLCWALPAKQESFLESMAETAKAVVDYFEANDKPMLYITVMNALSVDCDCDANQGDPVMADIGIVGSLDPVANDQAFMDMVFSSDDPGALELQARVNRQNGRYILPYAESIGLGSTKYELVEL